MKIYIIIKEYPSGDKEAAQYNDSNYSTSEVFYSKYFALHVMEKQAAEYAYKDVTFTIHEVTV